MNDKEPTPPNSSMLLAQLIRGVYCSQLIGVAAKLGVPLALRDGPRSSEDIARAVHADPSALHRALRGLVMYGVLIEPEAGHFALSPVGELLVPGVPGSMGDFALGSHEVVTPAICSLFDTVKTGKPAFELAFGRPVFAHFAAGPELGALFHGFMSTVNASIAAAIPGLYDFAGVDRLIDVGGGRGHYVASILEANPDLRGVLLEQPAVVAAAEAYLTSQGVRSRCEVVGGDFFECVPAGDVYLLSSILHDWDDERCAKVLENCRRAIAPRGRLLILEQLLPERVDQNPGAVFSDLEMLILLRGRERTLDEYRGLVESAGFRVTRVIPVPGSWGGPLRSIVETVAV